MSKQIPVKLDKALYDRLLELRIPPYNDINAVIERLLYHDGRRSRAAIAMESEGPPLSFEEEIKRFNEGRYAGSGIST